MFAIVANSPKEYLIFLSSILNKFEIATISSITTSKIENVLPTVFKHDKKVCKIDYLKKMSKSCKKSSRSWTIINTEEIGNLKEC